MKLEDQLTNKELSIKLKELGVKQDSYFYQVDFHNGYAEEHRDYEKNLKWELRIEGNSYNFKNRISAFTVAESYKEIANLDIHHEYNLDGIIPEKLADELAEQLIYLIENKLMEVAK